VGHAVVLTLAMIAALVLLSLWAALFVLVTGEIFVLGVLPRLRRFRRFVDESYAREARAAAAVERSALLGRMSDEHRAMLDVLERRADEIKSAAGDADDWLGVQRLIALYVRLAIAHRASTLAFSDADQVEITAQLAYLERERETAAPEQQGWLGQRLAILRRRRDLSVDAHAQRETIRHQLATISELIRWMHDQHAAVDNRAATAELSEILEGCERNVTALCRIATLHDGDAVEPSVLELGRQAAIDGLDGPVSTQRPRELAMAQGR
jgi:hypothetical protein